MEDLKRCPFCGAMVHIKTSKAEGMNDAFQIICSCGMAKTLAYKTPEKTRKAWNTRRAEE